MTHLQAVKSASRRLRASAWLPLRPYVYMYIVEAAGVIQQVQCNKQWNAI